MEATRSSETSVDLQTTWRYIPEGGTCYNHGCENLKYYMSKSSFILWLRLPTTFLFQEKPFALLIFWKAETFTHSPLVPMSVTLRNVLHAMQRGVLAVVENEASDNDGFLSLLLMFLFLSSLWHEGLPPARLLYPHYASQLPQGKARSVPVSLLQHAYVPQQLISFVIYA
jgi:hypothetical protein